MVSCSLFFQHISNSLFICLGSSLAPTHLICCSFCLPSAFCLPFKWLPLLKLFIQQQTCSPYWQIAYHTYTHFHGDRTMSGSPSPLIRPTCIPHSAHNQCAQYELQQNRSTYHAPALSVRVFVLLVQCSNFVLQHLMLTVKCIYESSPACRVNHVSPP